MSSKFLKIFFVFILFTSLLFSQGISDALRLAQPGLGFGTRALGMGNAYAGLSDDGSAMYFNPAGLGLMKRMEFAGSFDYYNLNNDATLFGNTTNYSNSSTKLNQISFVFPFPTARGSLVFGIGYSNVKNFTSALKFDGFNNGNNSLIQDLLNTDVPFDLYLTDDNGNTLINGKLNQSGTVLHDGSIENWSFSGAVEVYQNIFVGATFNILNGSYDFSNEYYEDDTKGFYDTQELAPGNSFSADFVTFNLDRSINWDLSGWDLKLGTMLQLSKMARLGFAIQFPKYFTVKEKFDVNGYSDFGDGTRIDLDPENYSDYVEYDINTPFSFNGGLSFNIRNLILATQLTFTDYSQTEFDDPVNLSNNDISNLNKDIKENLTTVVDYNFGAEYIFPRIGLRIRGGFFVQPSPYKDDPSDFDKKYLTAGIGYLLDETIALDLAYSHGWWKDIGDNYGFNESRTYQDITIDRILLSFSYRF
ncbi:MAG: outer membrane protein transport protein [Ignavibacterium sp.]